MEKIQKYLKCPALRRYERRPAGGLDLAKLDPALLADVPFPGTVTNLDPFFAQSRAGRFVRLAFVILRQQSNPEFK